MNALMYTKEICAKQLHFLQLKGDGKELNINKDLIDIVANQIKDLKVLNVEHMWYLGDILGR